MMIKFTNNQEMQNEVIVWLHQTQTIGENQKSESNIHKIWSRATFCIDYRKESGHHEK